MEAAQCEISFEIDYTSSIPVTSANAITTASYEIQGSGNPVDLGNIDPNGLTILPQIQVPEKYDLTVKLSVGGAFATSTSSFQIGDCNNGEIRTIFYNHAKRPESYNSNTVVDFLIKKNGQVVVDTKDVNTEYNNPIEQWKSFEARVGDRIEFSTDLIKSGSQGKTTGNMFTYSTTGTTGTVNTPNPSAIDALSLNSQDIGPNTNVKRIFAFIVDSKVNYALGTDYIQ
ncbi:hypothetical protein IW15_17060 [Chryseobacterium soli]|uniref:Uncharacterized protein n=1 Tax=Chryseobacterium soli TaxID=445961 RepID=A0A086A2H2_9FLAO|nr:hypothetical protein [Chryseobacterium soli]KFF10886.1 hypothetical protein IW15_17060 [Chryseobacterium soli]